MELKIFFFLLPSILTTSFAIPQKRTNRAQSPSAASVESIYDDANIFTVQSSLPALPSSATAAKQLTQQTGKQRESLGDPDQTSGEDDGRLLGLGENFNEFDSLGLQQQQQQHQGNPPFYFQGRYPGYLNGGGGGGGGPYYSPGGPQYFGNGPYYGGRGNQPSYPGQGGQSGPAGQYPGGQLPQTPFGLLPNGQVSPQFVGGGIQPGPAPAGGGGVPPFGGFGFNQFGGGAQFPILSSVGGPSGNVALDQFGVDKVQQLDGKKKTEIIKTPKATPKTAPPPPTQAQKNGNNSAPQNRFPGLGGATAVGPQQQRPQFFLNGFPQFGFPPPQNQFGQFGGGGGGGSPLFGQNFLPQPIGSGNPGSGGIGQVQGAAGNQESAVVQIEGGQFDPNGSGQVSGSGGIPLDNGQFSSGQLGGPFGQPFGPAQGFLPQGIPGGVSTSRSPPGGGQYPGFSIDYNPFAFYGGRPAFGFDPRLTGQYGGGQFIDGNNGNDPSSGGSGRSGRQGGLISAQIPQSSSSISRSTTVVKRHD